MNIAYCHLDYSLTSFQTDAFSFNQLPIYALYSIAQSRFYNQNARIFLICNLRNLSDAAKEILKKLNVEIVEQNVLISDRIKEVVSAYSKLETNFELANFNLVAIARYFFVEELMRNFKLQNLFHMEYDNLLYVDLDLIEKFLVGDCIFHDQSKIGLCGGTAFFRNVESLSRLNDNIQSILNADAIDWIPIYINDQAILSKIRYGTTNIISYFRDFSIDGTNYIFDPADYGQFLGGTNVGHSPGYLNHGTKLYEFMKEKHNKMSFGLNRLGLFMKLDGNFYKFVNLHVHNKKAIRNFTTFDK